MVGSVIWKDHSGCREEDGLEGPGWKQGDPDEKLVQWFRLEMMRLARATHVEMERRSTYRRYIGSRNQRPWSLNVGEERERSLG